MAKASKNNIDKPSPSRGDGSEKKKLIKGTVICKAKNCNNFLYKNQSSCDPGYCSHCF